CEVESHTDPALPLAVRCRYGLEVYPAQDWDTCRSGIKLRSDWSKVWTQQPIMTRVQRHLP
ncbi:hypothetical protein T265_14524, partial [Opisthorchis viverrini]